MASFPHILPSVLLGFLFALNIARSELFIGVNYGMMANNLPQPADTVKLLQSTSIEKVRLYGFDQAMIKALANTGISVAIGATSDEIPTLALDPTAATAWVNNSVIPFYPASNITLIMVGDEVSTDPNLNKQIAPAMQNMQKALDAASLAGKVKVSTTHSMSVLAMMSQSMPPSYGRFQPGLIDVMREILSFHQATGSPFAINPYPYFAYKLDPRPDTLAFSLFQPNVGRYDSTTQINYKSMFDSQVDAARSALNSLGFKSVDIIVSETGWPYKGDDNEVGPSIENAKAYIGGLINHLQSKVGTPLMPGKVIDTYLFSLYDENLKAVSSERAYGIFKTDLTPTYDVGLYKSNQETPTETKPRTWCVPNAGVSDAQLQANLDYACSRKIDCSPIQPGGACFEPNKLASLAAYAMNLFYQTNGRNSWDCDFSKTATISSQDPSYTGCVYPSST